MWHEMGRFLRLLFSVFYGIDLARHGIAYLVWVTDRWTSIWRRESGRRKGAVSYFDGGCSGFIFFLLSSWRGVCSKNDTMGWMDGR